MIKIKQFVPNFAKKILHEIEYQVSRSASYDYLSTDTKKVIIMLAADYGNLGDSAITYAQSLYLSEQFPGYEIIEVPLSRTYKDLKSLKRKISSEDVVTITGGGFMGTLYLGAEMQRQFIIEKFPENKIISFPQTAYFSSDKRGDKLKRKMSLLYGKHRNLTICAREEKSFTIMQELFQSNRVVLTPDIVLYLDERKPDIRRGESIAICIRDDKESLLGASSRQMIKDFMTSANYDVVEADTHIGDVVLSIDERSVELKKIWTTFASSQLVITDRLHGMIFCAITGTPCVAINNNNGKVGDVYSTWLFGLKNIVLVDGFQQDVISEYIKTLSSVNTEPLQAISFRDKFNHILKR